MSELKNAFSAAFPELIPAQKARARVLEMARIADQSALARQHRIGRLRLSLGIGFASIATIATMLLVPSNSAAAYLRHVRQKITDAKSAHMIEWSVGKDGRRVKSREIWYQDGKWRIDSAAQGTSTLTDGEKKWVYIQNRNTVRVSPDDGPFTHGPSGFTLTSMINDAGGRSKLQIVDEGSLERASMENPIDNSAITIWVDKKTDLPVRGEVAAETPNGRELDEVFEFEFNHPIASTVLAPSFPAGVKVVDESEGQRYWEQALAKSIAVFELPKSVPGTPDGKVVLRNFQVTDTGDVFLLYSGELNPDGITLSDDLGNAYARCDTFQPDMSDTNGNHVRGILVEGAKLNGAWFTPVKMQMLPWKPRRFTIQVAINWYKVDPEKMKHLPKGASVDMNQMIPMKTPFGKAELRVEAPTCSVVPDYAPYMGDAPSEEFDVRLSEDEARFRYLYFRSRYSEAEPYLRDKIAITEARERETGQRWVQSQSFYMMYLNLKFQGRREEARQWLKRILDEPGGDRNDVSIRDALRSEGMN